MKATKIPPVASSCKLYVEGAFGTGKTDLGLSRIQWVMKETKGNGRTVTVLVPSRYALRRLRRRLQKLAPSCCSPFQIQTFPSLMAQAVELAWPVLALEAGFEDPRPSPIFLNLESAQHLLAPEIRERALQGQFEAATQRQSPGNNRLLSQLVDNLSKSAMYGYPLEEAYSRLAHSVPAGRFREGRIEALRTALKVSRRFRRNCMEQGLVSLDLLYELFDLLLKDESLVQSILLERCQHLIAFECEELDFACHRFLTRTIPKTESSLCLADPHGGFRYFLGAYPKGLPRLAEISDMGFKLALSPDSGRTYLERRLEKALQREGFQKPLTALAGPELHVRRASQLDVGVGSFLDCFNISHHEHFSDTLSWTTETVASLILEEGLQPSQVVILAPIVGNALRFTLEQKLHSHGLEIFTHRPSRMLKDEPSVQALFALTCLAHPHWRIPVDAVAKRIVLQLVMGDMEGWRAHSLVKVWNSTFQPFITYPVDLQERIGNRFGVRFDALRAWVRDYQNEERYDPLDVFLARLHDELLTSPGFSFGQDAEATRIAHQLMQSARRFRILLEEIGIREDATDNSFLLEGESGKIYMELVQAGLIGGLHLPQENPPSHSVVLASAYNFLMQGYQVEHQFWLDVNHQSWGHRMHQPLTHPHVLEPSWEANRAWADADENRISQTKIWRLLLGLLRRTGRRVHVAISIFGEKGHDQKGPLLRTLNSMLYQESVEGKAVLVSETCNT